MSIGRSKDPIGQSTRPCLKKLCNSINEIASAIGTPFYAYDLDTIDASCTHLTTSVEKHISTDFIFYVAMFALPNVSIINRLFANREHFGVACNSLEELIALKESGWNRWEDVSFVGGVKSRHELELIADFGSKFYASSAGNARIMVDLKGDMPIGLRLDLTGQQLKGLTTSEFRLFSDSLNASNGAKMMIHSYPGTAVKEFDLLSAHARVLCDIAREQRCVHELNFGGGFWFDYGSPTGLIGEMFDYDAYFSFVNSEVQANPTAGQLRLAWEPGRVVFASAGIFVTRVNEIRMKAPNLLDVYVDSSFVHLPSPKITETRHLVQVVGPNGSVKVGTRYQGRFCGDSTLSSDLLLPGLYALPEIEAGDYLLILDVGAYGHSGSYNFLGRARTPEVLLDENWKTIRERQKSNHLLEGLTS